MERDPSILHQQPWNNCSFFSKRQWITTSLKLPALQKPSLNSNAVKSKDLEANIGRYIILVVSAMQKNASRSVDDAQLQVNSLSVSHDLIMGLAFSVNVHRKHNWILPSICRQVAISHGTMFAGSPRGLRPGSYFHTPCHVSAVRDT